MAKKVTQEAVTEKPQKATKKKKNKKHRTVKEGCAYITAGFNNTVVTITDLDGNTLIWNSAGKSGFKGTKKSTPYAAQISAQNAAEAAKAFGMENVKVFVKGVGPGREQSIRGLHAGGLEIETISDATPMPHNGCRVRKARRV